MNKYISPQHQTLLKASNLTSFVDVWGHQAEWFEAPNMRRGGWSGVCRLELRQQGNDSTLGVFLKRQENHQRRTYQHPFRGEPTFACEFRMLRFLEAQGISAPRPVFFASQYTEKCSRAILMTEELENYRPLDQVVRALFSGIRPTLEQQRQLITAVAQTVRQLHDAGVQHRSLYPKHLFVRWIDAGIPEVAIIDLEKSRRTLLPMVRTVYDLATLNRHAEFWSRSRRLFFLKAYLKTTHLSPFQRLLFRLIERRSNRRRSTPS